MVKSVASKEPRFCVSASDLYAGISVHSKRFPESDVPYLGELVDGEFRLHEHVSCFLACKVALMGMERASRHRTHRLANR